MTDFPAPCNAPHRSPSSSGTKITSATAMPSVFTYLRWLFNVDITASLEGFRMPVPPNFSKCCSIAETLSSLW